MYAELIGNYKKWMIKNFHDNKLDPGAFDMNLEILRESGNTKMITMIQY